MLKITKNTEHQLTLEDKHRTAGFIAILFVLFSLFGFITLIMQVATVFNDHIRANNGLLWLITVGVFVTLAISFILIGIGATLNFLIGTTCLLDKESGTITLQQMNIFRRVKTEYSIYAVASIGVEQNDEVHAIGIFFNLRDSRRIPIASFRQEDIDAMNLIVHHLRTFLYG